MWTHRQSRRTKGQNIFFIWSLWPMDLCWSWENVRTHFKKHQVHVFRLEVSFHCAEGNIHASECIIFLLYLFCGKVFSRVDLYIIAAVWASGVGIIVHFLTLQCLPDKEKTKMFQANPASVSPQHLVCLSDKPAASTPRCGFSWDDKHLFLEVTTPLHKITKETLEPYVYILFCTLFTVLGVILFWTMCCSFLMQKHLHDIKQQLCGFYRISAQATTFQRHFLSKHQTHQFLFKMISCSRRFIPVNELSLQFSKLHQTRKMWKLLQSKIGAFSTRLWTHDCFPDDDAVWCNLFIWVAQKHSQHFLSVPCLSHLHVYSWKTSLNENLNRHSGIHCPRVHCWILKSIRDCCSSSCKRSLGFFVPVRLHFRSSALDLRTLCWAALLVVLKHWRTLWNHPQLLSFTRIFLYLSQR